MMVSVWGLGVKGEEVCKVEEATTKTTLMMVNGREDRCVARQVSFLMLLAPLHCCMAHDPVSDLGGRRLKGERDGPNAFILQPVPPHHSFLISFKRPQNPKASLSISLFIRSKEHMRGGRKGKVLSLRNLGESIYNPPAS